jgi:hypothetical protein
MATAYSPALLPHGIEDTKVEAQTEDDAETEEEVEQMRTSTDENALKLARQMGIDWEEAWTILRSRELEDGASIVCSEECEGHSSAMDELVAAARRGKKKRRERRGYASEEEEKEKEKVPYVPPPKVRDAEQFWPFMRCKNVANVLCRYGSEPIPRNHHGLLQNIAKIAKMSVEDLKKTSPWVLFKDNYRVMGVLGKSSRW